MSAAGCVDLDAAAARGGTKTPAAAVHRAARPRARQGAHFEWQAFDVHASATRRRREIEPGRRIDADSDGAAGGVERDVGRAGTHVADGDAAATRVGPQRPQRAADRDAAAGRVEVQATVPPSTAIGPPDVSAFKSALRSPRAVIEPPLVSS